MHRADGLLGHGILGGAGQLGDAEVGDLYAAVPENHDVMGLNVPVDDPPAMGMAQRAHDLGNEMLGLPPVQGGAPALHILLQCQPIHQLHDDIVQPVRPAHVIYRYDVGVGQHGHRLGLIVEPAAEVGILCQLRL